MPNRRNFPAILASFFAAAVVCSAAQADEKPQSPKDNPYSRRHGILPAALSDNPLSVSIRVGEDVRRSPVAPSIALRLAIDNLQGGDAFAVTLNGKPVKRLRPTGKKTTTAKLNPDQLKQGQNHVTLKLSHRSAKSAKPRTVTALEIDVVSAQQDADADQPQDSRNRILSKKVAVLISPKADRLEQFAARELCGYLDKLYGIKTRPTTKRSRSAEMTFLVGSPKTNSNISRALGEKRWPKLSDQGIVLKRTTLDGKPVLIVGGGSSVATMWAVYELVERWGVRYLIDRDVIPAKREWNGTPALDIVMEPNMRIRCWRLVNASLAPFV